MQIICILDNVFFKKQFIAGCGTIDLHLHNYTYVKYVDLNFSCHIRLL